MAVDPCAIDNMLSLEQALAIVSDHVTPIYRQQTVPITQAMGRVLASSLYAPLDVPPAACSVMDGFAFSTQSDLDQELRVVGTSLAGAPYNQHVLPGECVVITTGAYLPPGCDCVEMQERVERRNDCIHITRKPSPGQFVRQPGHDVEKGQLLIEKGTPVCASAIGLLASQGIDHVQVIDKVRVAVMSTGDELVDAGKALPAHGLFDANRPALIALLRQMQLEVLDLGIIKDDLASTQQALTQAASQADVVISSGGVSVGQADHVTQALENTGQVGFWKVAIKPGKPFAFGHINDTLYCGLPGNPVSSMVTFDLLVKPLLSTLMGLPDKQPIQHSATLTSPVHKRPGRQEFQRGVCTWDPQQQLWYVQPTGPQTSSTLASMVAANCYIVLNSSQGDLPVGSKVTIRMLSQPLKPF